jgi:hypothetical protein
MRRLVGLCAALAVLGALTGCGGGGGDSDTPPSQSGSSNWNEMTWNQDNWS